ncbi:MAG: hypothetical protein HRT44_07215, partial [Bdellovibrionales bacterium]|nr:hypothetical protein [Bdellovibrionales bacterium]NQZ19026.1 hypothetical protein [Bdellovibrionales bacterium]
MKYIALLLLPLIFAACTSKDQNNNTHNATPVYEANPNLVTQSVTSVEEVIQLTRKARPMVNSGDNEQLIQAILEMQVYTLNLENLTNPTIHHEGNLQPDYRRLVDLYGYALSLGISRNLADQRFDQALLDYRGVIFNSCHLDNRDCRTAAPFKGPYGVTILAHMIQKDIENLEIQENIADQPIKNTIFSLYVLKSFRESSSNVTGDLFIRFSATFFRVVDIANITDELYRTYLTDLQNQMVKQSQGEVSATSCSIFESINPLQFETVSSGLSSSLISQLNNHFYKCIDPEEIKERLIEVEREKQQAAVQEIEEIGSWGKLYSNFHG